MIPKLGDVVRFSDGAVSAVVGETDGGKQFADLGHKVEVSDYSLDNSKFTKVGKLTLYQKGDLPPVGSKLWKWSVEKFEDFDYEESHTLETAWGMYEIAVNGGEAEVVFEDPDMNEHEIATFDLFRFGKHTDGGGTKLTKKQGKEAIRSVKRFCELDARRMARKAAKKPKAVPK